MISFKYRKEELVFCCSKQVSKCYYFKMLLRHWSKEYRQVKAVPRARTLTTFLLKKKSLQADI